VYTEDYTLTIPEIFTYAQVGENLQIDLEWDSVTGAEGYRIERSIDDPLFTSSTWQYTGMNTSFTDTIPSYETDYYYRAKLEVPSMGLESLWSTVRLVEIGYAPADPPVAEFISNHTNGNVPLAVSFYDLSTNVPTSWIWNFGDGATGSVQHPSHTYTGLGSFTVSLTATNTAGSDTETKTDYITVSSQQLVPSASAVVGIVPLTVSFGLTSLSGDWATYLWDFGDGHTSTERSPTHTYSTTGYHNVVVKAFDDYGNSTYVAMPGWIRVGDLYFSASPRTSDSIPFVASFDSTRLAPTGYNMSNWDWDFGDATLHSVETGPVHTYNAYNKYNLTLAARINKQ
jgi:PKD repeat protein